MEFCGKEYWSGLPFPPPGDLSDSGIELTSPTLQAEFFKPLSHKESPQFSTRHVLKDLGFQNNKRLMQIGETHAQSPMERKLIYFPTSFFFFHSDHMAVALKERIELLAVVRGILVYASHLLTHQATSVLWWHRWAGWGQGWEGGPRGREYMYTYSWLISLYSRNQYNIVKQL